jgi:hypothetical protein
MEANLRLKCVTGLVARFLDGGISPGGRDLVFNLASVVRFRRQGAITKSPGGDLQLFSWKDFSLRFDAGFPEWNIPP